MLERTKQLKSRDTMKLGQLSAQTAFNFSVLQNPKAESPKVQPYLLLQNNNWSLNQKQYKRTRASFSCVGFPGYWEESLFLCYVNKLDSKYTQEERKMILSRLVAKHLTTKKLEFRALSAACSRLGLSVWAPVCEKEKWRGDSEQHWVTQCAPPTVSNLGGL